MQVDDRIHLVGSGSYGFGLTDPHDCHIYLVDGGSELALVDVCAGMGAVQVVENVRRAGFDPALIRHILCTHAHGDHAGGAARMRALLPNASVSLSRVAADYIRHGDETGTSIVSFLLDHGGRRSLFAGDVVFHGGTILLQNIHDCSVEALVASLRKLRGLGIDALLPGHFAFSLREGQQHIERANQVLDRLLIPPQAVSTW